MANKNNQRKPNTRKDIRDEKGKDNNTNHRGSSNRYSRDSQRDTEHCIDVGRMAGRSNDPSWYRGQPELINDAARISMYKQAGATLPWLNVNLNAATGEEGNNKEPVPGIMIMRMVTGPGVAKDATDGLNLAAQGLFEYTRSKLSTLADYHAADQMAVVLAIDNIYTMYAHIARIFGLANVYSNQNYYLPKALVMALGLSSAGWTQLIANLNIYRSKFNHLIMKAASLYMPVAFPYITRHTWLYSNVFRDSDTAKSQLYAYEPAMIGVFSDTASDQGSAIIYENVNGKSMATLLTQFDNMIEAVRNSDSARKIQADMRRAYGDEFSAYRLGLIMEDYVVLPIFDKYALLQLHNTDIVDFDMFETESWNITQSVDRNILISQPYIAEASTYTAGYTGRLVALRDEKKILNFFWNDVTEDDILEATRGKIMMRLDQETDRLYIDSYGADVCVGAYIYTLNPQTNLIVIEAEIHCSYLGNASTDLNAIYWGQFPYLAASMAAFDWMPMLGAPWGNALADKGTVQGIRWILDWNNWTFVDPAVLTNLNTSVNLSMWKVPNMGQITGK